MRRQSQAGCLGSRFSVLALHRPSCTLPRRRDFLPPQLPTVPSRGTPTPAPLCTTELDLDAQRPTDYDCRCFFLHRPRAELYRRIDGRVEEMMASGLLTVGSLVLLGDG